MKVAAQLAALKKLDKAAAKVATAKEEAAKMAAETELKSSVHIIMYPSCRKLHTVKRALQSM